MAAGMMMSDLGSSGFDVRYNSAAAEMKVQLSNRSVSKAEIEYTLLRLGYESCQFELSRLGDAVIVKAVV